MAAGAGLDATEGICRSTAAAVRGGERGDLFCRVVVETPVSLSADQRELLRRFDESLRGDGRGHTPREAGFFEGVKRFFAGGAD